MFRRMFVITAATTVIALAASRSSEAHHSFAAEFDIDQPIVLSGQVIRVDFTNPHSWIHVRVTTDGGSVQEWAIEGAAPNALLRRGWSRNSLPAGTEVTIRGYRSRDGALRASGASITLPDGSSLDPTSTGVGAPPPRTN